MPARSLADKTVLKTDAVNRLFRAVYVAIIANLIVDVWPMVLHAMDTGVYDWHAIGLAALRVAGQGAGAYLLRRFGDGSSLPTPIPPSDPGEPSVDATPSKVTPIKPRKPRASAAAKPKARTTAKARSATKSTTKPARKATPAKRR